MTRQGLHDAPSTSPPTPDPGEPHLGGSAGPDRGCHSCVDLQARLDAALVECAERDCACCFYEDEIPLLKTRITNLLAQLTRERAASGVASKCLALMTDIPPERLITYLTMMPLREGVHSLVENSLRRQRDEAASKYDSALERIVDLEDRVRDLEDQLREYQEVA